jgi:hypothetical protein
MKSFITGATLIVSLALSGNAAIAAVGDARRTVTHVAHPRAQAHVAARHYARAPLYLDVNQFIESMLGGPLPPQYARIVRDAVRESAHHRSTGSYDDSPTYEYPTATTDSSAASDSQAASDAENQAIQQMNDTNAMNASNAAAAAQNAADTAATMQTEINSGM